MTTLARRTGWLLVTAGLLTLLSGGYARGAPARPPVRRSTARSTAAARVVDAEGG
jgi:hypothetical protein